MKKISTLLLCALCLAGCAGATNESEASNTPDAIATPEQTAASAQEEVLYQLDDSVVDNVRSEISKLLKDKSENIEIDFRNRDEFIYHVLANANDDTYIFRYNAKIGTIELESSTENGEVTLMYSTYAAAQAESYATLGMDVPTLIDMDTYNYIIENDDIKEY